jgi:HPt (histidine-containing phosphotransfer) domain-containing protein
LTKTNKKKESIVVGQVTKTILSKILNSDLLESENKLISSPKQKIKTSLDVLENIKLILFTETISKNILTKDGNENLRTGTLRKNSSNKKLYEGHEVQVQTRKSSKKMITICNDFENDPLNNLNSPWKKEIIEQENEEESNSGSHKFTYSNAEISHMKRTSSSGDTDDEDQFDPLPYEEDNYDHVGLEDLKDLCSDDEDFEKEIIEFFVENFPHEIKSLEAEIIAKNKNQIKFWIHKMKTPLGMFGLKKINEKLEKIEKICNTSESETAMAEFKSLSNNLNVIYDEFNIILKKYN